MPSSSVRLNQNYFGVWIFSFGWVSHKLEIDALVFCQQKSQWAGNVFSSFQVTQLFLWKTVDFSVLSVAFWKLFITHKKVVQQHDRRIQVAWPLCICWWLRWAVCFGTWHIFFFLVGHWTDLPQVKPDTTVNMNPILHVLCQASEH